jgi:hypothetical protein
MNEESKKLVWVQYTFVLASLALFSTVAFCLLS